MSSTTRKIAITYWKYF